MKKRFLTKSLSHQQEMILRQKLRAQFTTLTSSLNRTMNIRQLLRNMKRKQVLRLQL